MKQYKTFAWLWIAVGVIAGALGAHALKKVLSIEALESFKTGVLYQLLAGSWMLFYTLESSKKPLNWKSPHVLILAGSILFSVSIYLLVLLPLIGVSAKFIGPVTPIGGVLMIIGLIKAAFEQFKAH